MVRARSASLWKDAKPQRPTRSSDAMPGAGGALASGGGAAGCGCGAVAQATRVSASAAVVTTIVARDMVVAPRTRTITPLYTNQHRKTRTGGTAKNVWQSIKQAIRRVILNGG